uniref:Uncharacterized protein n=1 Tax=Arundo donax TaxID=35708 RepID=A0A0A9HAP3_ARUDO
MQLGLVKSLPGSSQFGAQFLSKVAAPGVSQLETRLHTPAKG